MSLSTGTKIGPYEIVAPIGAGGMGEVYRAKDTKLDRDVAIKVLPESFALDADRVARFTREAKTLASLNHPNIAAIYGIEESASTRALVMELVDGEDLSVVISKNAALGNQGGLRTSGLPLTETLPIATQIADALEAAHEQGIVHRDLKPQNIKVRADGTVKVLDFGLAKAMDPAGASGADAMKSPTMTARATQMGMIIGTAAYMAPEQARGRAVDRRADIWAFGVVLYEMLSGRRAFEGEDISVTLANVIKEGPKWDALPGDLPAPLARLLRRCLEKDPKKRLRDIGDARLDIDEASQPSDAASASSSLALAQSRRREHVWRNLAIGAIAVAVIAIGTAMVMQRRGAASTGPAPASPLTMTPLTSTGNAALGTISSDGKYVAYVQTDDSGQSVWIRQLASGSTVRIVAPTPGLRIFGLTIASDASFVDFVRSRTTQDAFPSDLWRAPFLGGQSRKILDDVTSAPGWSPDGKQMAYLVNAGNERRLMTANADGSQPRVVASRTIPLRFTTLTRAFRPDLRPVWLPDGRAIAVVGEDDVRAPGRFQVIRVDVATGAETETSALSEGGARDMGMTLGRDGTSLFINMSGTESGPPQVVKVALDNSEATPLTNDLAAYGSVSLAGDAIVTTRRQGSSGLWLSDAAARGPRQLGRAVPSLLNGLTWAGPARLLYQASLAGGVGVWSTSVEDGSSTLVVPGGAEAFASADGRTLVFTRSGRELWRADGDGGHSTRVPDAVVAGPGLTPDGSRVFYISTQSGKQVGWVVDLAGGPPRPFTTMEVGSAPRVSPDGRHVVYFGSGTEGRAVIMPVGGGAPVREVPIPRAPVRWTPDGRGLAYLDAAQENISVQPIEGGAPRPLTTFTDRKQIRDFDWSPDGKQLAIVRSVSTSDIVLLKGVR